MSLKYEIISLDEPERWDEIVQSFPKHDVFYLRNYVEAFQLNGDGQPLLFYFEDGGTRAINVVMKRDIADDERFKGVLKSKENYDFITPYGYGGFLFDGNSTENILTKYEEYCRNKNIISEFVRFNLFNGYEKHYFGEVETRTHNIIRNLDLSIDEMMYDFEHKVRKNIKKAINNNLKVMRSNDESFFSDFLKVYYATMERTGAKKSFYFKPDFFNKINALKENIIYFNVLKDDKVISTELVMYDNENAYSFLGGTLSEYFDLRPNELLKIEVIKWAKEKGLNSFVLGGGYGSDDGIFRYKKSFAPNGIVNFYIGKKIFNQQKYDEIANMRDEIKKESDFFPLYRA